jgi:Double-GTPase 2
MAIPEYKITMLGPSGVGKTSLLTAIYEKFEQIAGQIEITIDPESDTLKQIQHCLTQLKSLTKTNNDIVIKKGVGVRGSTDPFSFYFNMGVRGRKPSLRLHFQDYPGGWIQNRATPEQMDEVVKFLVESVAILIPIDATAIMERNGKYHELVNLPTTVTALIKKSYQDLTSPRLIILAPVKCEKYMKDQESTQKLLVEIQDQYQQLIQFFNASTLRSNIAVVVTPIQTVGNVIFLKLKEDEYGEPNFCFCRTGINARYAPKDSEQPLKYLLQFILKLYMERGNSIVKFFRTLLEIDEPFRQAATKFAKEPANPNCQVLQGDKWLDI